MLRLITPRMMMKKIPRYPEGSHKKNRYFRVRLTVGGRGRGGGSATLAPTNSICENFDLLGQSLVNKQTDTQARIVTFTDLLKGSDDFLQTLFVTDGGIQQTFRMFRFPFIIIIIITNRQTDLLRQFSFFVTGTQTLFSLLTRGCLRKCSFLVTDRQTLFCY